mmetsp:Transcript_1332/g.2995  ORF Transcript_1332/g.2995 Transcript_1332/m.2995 type:complete len:237 (-) Transcript_1332:2651-3361(-)
MFLIDQARRPPQGQSEQTGAQQREHQRCVRHDEAQCPVQVLLPDPRHPHAFAQPVSPLRRCLRQRGRWQRLLVGPGRPRRRQQRKVVRDHCKMVAQGHVGGDLLRRLHDQGFPWDVRAFCAVDLLRLATGAVAARGPPGVGFIYIALELKLWPGEQRDLVQVRHLQCVANFVSKSRVTRPGREAFFPADMCHAGAPARVLDVVPVLFYVFHRRERERVVAVRPSTPGCRIIPVRAA